MTDSCIAEFGSFFAGGRTVDIAGEPTREIAFTKTASLPYDPNGRYHFEQAYVQYFIPKPRRHRLPVVLLHGGGMTGAMWEQTPDGRTGWAQQLLRLGHAVYIVDNVERGRAGWAPFDSVWSETPIIRSAQETWSLFRVGRGEDFAQRRGFEGQRFPIQAFDEFIRHAVPRWLGNNDAALRGLLAVLDRVGPCLVVAHSHGGEVAYRAAQAAPELVRGVIGIEPSGFTADIDPDCVAGKPFLFVHGDFLDATPLWARLSAAADLYADRLTQAAGRVTTWRLPAMGIAGNSHMLMMDDNSDELATRISQWIHAECAPT